MRENKDASLENIILQLNRDENDKLAQQVLETREKGYNIYKVKVTIDPQSSWTAVRCFQVLSELSQIGNILQSIPSKEDIENGKAQDMIELLVASSQIRTINKAINTVPEIKDSRIEAYDPQEENNTRIPTNILTSKNISVANSSVSSSSPAVQDSQPTGDATSRKSLTADTVRVDVRLLDNLMNLIGEMVIDRNRIRQISRDLDAKYADDNTIKVLGETSAHVMKLVNDLQENILKARMLHIGTILNGFPRMVRDLAQKANKNIEFIIEGQETELDRSIIEQIRDPLLHLLRNAVDHGIESAEQRRLSGKPEKGTIRLSARQEQSYILISVSDDGGGIDVEKVKQKALARGFISADEAARLSQVEALNLILLSGLSTSDVVTEISGRGVGMDVVRTNVEGLTGSL